MNIFSKAYPSPTELTELLPGIMNQLGPDNMDHLKQIADSMTTTKNLNACEFKGDDDDDVPDLIENFEDVSKL